MNFETKIINCIICDHAYVPERCGILACPQCGLLYSGQKAGFGNTILGMSTIAHQNYATVASALERFLFLRGAKILDVGCAEGGFAELMISKGAVSLGLEPDKDSASEAIKKKIPLTISSFEDFVSAEKEFDAIVFNDVFEHMQDPVLSVIKSLNLLKSKGYLLINAPVSSGFIFKTVRLAARFGFTALYQRIWAQGLSSPHIYFYSETNLSSLLSKYNFQLVDKGRLVALSTDGMYKRVRSTYGPVSALAISLLASIIMPIYNMLQPDVMYYLFEKNEKEAQNIY